MRLEALVARADGSFLLRRQVGGARADAARLGAELGVEPDPDEDEAGHERTDGVARLLEPAQQRHHHEHAGGQQQQP